MEIRCFSTVYFKTNRFGERVYFGLHIMVYTNTHKTLTRCCCTAFACSRKGEC